MEHNENLRKEIFSIIEKQLKANDPPETKKTFKRLQKQGFSTFVIKQYIGQCVAVEIFNTVKHKEPYDEDRYVRHLKALPKEPFD